MGSWMEYRNERENVNRGTVAYIWHNAMALCDAAGLAFPEDDTVTWAPISDGVLVKSVNIDKPSCAFAHIIPVFCDQEEPTVAIQESLTQWSEHKDLGYKQVNVYVIKDEDEKTQETFSTTWAPMLRAAGMRWCFVKRSALTRFRDERGL